MLAARILFRGLARMSPHGKDMTPILSLGKQPRLLKVAIIGMPNAGKSTLINRLMELDVCPVSKRVHTTRQTQKAIFLQNDTQIVFIDTPGVVNRKEIKKFQLSTEFATAPETAIKDADVIGVIHDISNRILRHKLDPRLVNVLNQFPEKDSILILNKVDAVKFKRSLLDAVRYLTDGLVGGKPISVTVPKVQKRLSKEDLFARASIRQQDLPMLEKEKLLRNQSSDLESTDDRSENDTQEFEVNGWGGFRDVFMISALSGDGVNLLQDYFVANAQPAAWEFDEEVLTDCPPMDLAQKILKAKLLEFLPQEIPYTVTPSLDFWEENAEGTLRIVFGLHCPKERYAKIVIGQGGSNINQITIAMEKDLTRILQKTIDLHLKVILPEKSSTKKTTS